MRKVIATTSSYEIGLTGLLTEQALTISEQCEPGQFLFLSGEGEQYRGLFEKLREHAVRNEAISGFDHHYQLLRLVKVFSEYASAFKPDIVHVNTNWQLIIAVLAKALCGQSYKIIYTIHGYRHNFPFRAIWAKCAISALLYLFADRVIAPSSFLKRQFSILARKTDILFIGVDRAFLGAYVPLALGGPKKMVFAGAFREGKNQEWLIRALKRYVQATGDFEVELYLPGDGVRRIACMRLCEELGVEDKVVFPGYLDREKMLECYRMCQFALIPSNVETFGQCISEPLSLGRIVLSRRVGVAEDVIIDGKTGYFFDTEEELLQVFLKVLPNSSAWEAVSRAAYNCRHVFDWTPICCRYLNMIERV